jgi:hypothetical protein
MLKQFQSKTIIQKSQKGIEHRMNVGGTCVGGTKVAPPNIEHLKLI